MIAINLIRQYIFCPRIVYYNLFTNIKPIYPRQVSLGIDYHDLQNQMLSSRKFKKLKIDYCQILRNKYFEDEKLNICGIIDLAFISNNEVIPIEFKHIKSKPKYSHILQLTAYGLLLEKQYKKFFKESYIIYSNNMKFYNVKITENHKKDLFYVINNIEKMYENDTLPQSDANEKKCSQCEYLNFCDDRI